MMKKMKRKGIAGILSAVLIIAGAFLIGTSDSKVLANEQELDINKFLNVKWQMSEELENGTKNLRIVTTIDADEDETYGNVGFNITFLAQKNEDEVVMDHTVDSVFHRIDANEGGIEYEYGPKAFHSTSEWLATCTITKIPAKYWDNGIVIKPYVTKKGNPTKIWGQHRYLTMKDQENNVITIPVKGEKDITGIEDNDYAIFHGFHKQDGYTHVRLQVSDLTSLPSISQYTVKYDGGSETVKYRYLLAGAEDCGDTVTDHSWYTMSDVDNKVIVTPSEMRSFVLLSKTSTYGGFDKNFAGETIYLGADITLDKNTLWKSIGATNNSETYGKYFAGHFDGNMHTIAGVTVNKAQGYVFGLFGEVKGENAIVENFILSNSSFTINTDKINTYSGCVVGSLNQGTVRNVKCDSTVKLTIGKKDNHYNGGLVGRAIDGVIENCWFDGRIEGFGTYQGGILGGLYNNGATCSIEQCLFTGNIKLNEYTGGICGDVRSDGAVVNTLTIRDTLYVGDMSGGEGKYYKGLFIGNVASSGKVVADNLYGHNSTFVPNVKNIGWANTTGTNANRTIDAEVTHLARADFNGATGYLNIDLDYYVPEDHEDGTWVIVEGQAPHLKVFDDVAGEQYKYIDIRKIGGQTDDVRTVWHKPTANAETYILYSPADLRGFQEVAKTDDFAVGGAKDTVKLGADINLNLRWDATKPTEGNPTKWTPIGRYGSDTTTKEFAGIFDGDMHSISGVYINEGVAKLGLFGQTATGCEIKNLELKNSYIYSSTDYYSLCRTGAIVGNLTGSICNVKCDADVVVVGQGRCVGGIAGTANNASIKNCCFVGKVRMAGTTKDSGQRKDMGGILGGMFNTSEKTKCTIANCLVTGDLDIAQAVGGICGIVYTNSTLNVSDTLFAGKFVEANTTTTTGRGTVLGDVASGSITLTDVYVKDGTGLSVKIGNKGSNVDTGITVLQSSELTGDAAYANMYLDFYDKDKNSTGAWFAVENSYPILTSFADTLKALDVTVDTYWFDSENQQLSYTLNTVAEFRGFQKLAAKNNFHGIEIKLGADINLNPTWTAGETAPAIVWTPIGRLATNASSVIPFRGTFNGQGHTIKGIYVNNGLERIGLFATTGADAVIKDFTLENSYIKNTNETTTEVASVGSVVGRLGGTLDTVKSSAEVVASGAQYTGGLVGDINSSVGATITNCWFAGHVGGTGTVRGQLLGGVRNVGTNDTEAKCTISHCLATGTIVCQKNIGGLVGTSWTGAEVSLSDTLFAGKILEVNTDHTHGTVVGNAMNGKVTVTDVYVLKGTGFNESSKILGAVREEYQGKELPNYEHNESQKAKVINLEAKQLYLGAARTNTNLTICDEADYGNSEVVGGTKFWYISDKHPVLASFSEPVDSYELKVATYNIGHGRKNGESQATEDEALDELMEYISCNDFDVCLLQEVDEDQISILNELQSQGYKVEYHTLTYAFGWGNVGVAIISKYDMLETKYQEIDQLGGREPRGLYQVMIDVNEDSQSDAAVICAHFDDLSSSARTKGVELLQGMVNDIYEETPNMPIIFGGDLNQAYVNENDTPYIADVFDFLNSVTAGVGGLHTAHTPGEDLNTVKWYQLDYIFTNDFVGLGKAEVQKVYMSDGTTELSDHRPLVATLYIKAQESN